jgi:CRISP-associated protein Cas1
MQLLFVTKGLVIKKRGDRLLVIENGQEFSVSLRQVSSVAMANHCFVSTAALRLAVEHEIPVFILDDLGNVQARMCSPAFVGHARLRRQQVYFADSPQASDWVKELFGLKTEQQAQNLRFLANRKPSFDTQIEQAMLAMDTIQLKMSETTIDQHAATHQDKWQQLMGMEGGIARHYWQAIAICFGKEGLFERRSRRPATDAFNCALNYLYGILYTVTESALFAAGLDPHLGILQTDGYDSPSLSFDLIEPFRPWADRFLLEKLLQHEFEDHYFDKKSDGGFWLNKEGKKWLIPPFNEYMQGTEPFLTMRRKRADSIYEYAGMLRKTIENFEKP